MNALITANNVLRYNVAWWGFWTVQMWTDALKMHNWKYGRGDRTPIDHQGWRAASCFELGFVVMCIWALKLPSESKRGFLRCMLVPYIATFLWLIKDRALYSTSSWSSFIVSLTIGSILTYLGGWSKSLERVVPPTKSLAPEPVIDAAKVHAA